MRRLNHSSVSVDQRRSARCAAHWTARYRLHPGGSWRVCRVIDVSDEGVALELGDTTLVSGIVGPIEIQIPSTGGEEQLVVTLRAAIRHQAQADGGRLTVGLELGELRAAERRTLRYLVERGSRAA